MVRIPLPSEGLQAGITGGFTAPSVVPRQDPTGQQIGVFGRALQTAAAAAQDIFQQMEDEQNLAAAQEKVALGEEEIRTHSKEYLGLLGEKAHGIGRARASQGLRNQLLKLESSLENPVQRGLYRRWLDRRMQDVESTFDRHEMKQTQVWLAGARKARIEASVDSAAQSFILLGDKPNEDGTPSAFRLQRNTAVQEARNRAQDLGLSPEETEAFVQDVTEDIHRLIVEGLADSGRGSEAKEYLQGVDRKELSQDGRRRLQGTVERASVADEGARLALRVRGEVVKQWRKALADPGRTQPMAPLPDGDTLQVDGTAAIQAMFEAGKISLEVRDAAIGEVENLAAMRRNETTVAENAAREAGEAWLRQNPMESVEAMPPTLYQQAQGLDVLDDLRAFSERKRYVTDESVYLGMLQDFETGRMRDVPFSVLFKRYRAGLSDTDLRHAESLHRRANDVATQEDFSFLTPKQALDDLAERLNVRKNPQRYDILRKNVEGRIRAWEANNPGKKISGAPDQLEKIIISVESDVARIQRGWAIFDPFFSDEFIAVDAQTPEELLASFRESDGKRIPVISPAEVAHIKRKLKKADIEPTPEMIVELWREAQRRGGRR